MDCTKAEKLLVEYLYQELAPEKTVQVEKHLEVCDACAKTLENWRAIHRGYQRVEDVPPAPSYMNQRILAAAREEATRKPSFGERLIVLLKPAIVLPVLVFGILAFLILPQKQTEMAMAPEPAAIKAAPPAAGPHENAPGRVDSDEAKKLKSPGYVDEAKPAEDALSDLAREKTESADYRERDASLSQLKKDAPYTEAPADTTAGMEAPKEAESYRQEYKPGYPSSQQAPSVLQEGQQETAPPAAPATKTAAPAMKGQAPVGTFAGDKNSNFARAQNDFQKNEFTSGKRAAETAIQQDKEGDLAAQFHKAGRDYQSQGEPEQAIVQYNLVLNNYPSYPESPDVLLRLAESYEQIGAYDQAIQSYQRLQRVAKMRKVATEKIDTLNKKQQVQEQLRSLGYVKD